MQDGLPGCPDCSAAAAPGNSVPGTGGVNLVQDKWKNPTGGKVRGCDTEYGCGNYGASRGSRKHDGSDYESVPGQEIVSPVNGEIIRGSNPYKNDPSYNGVFIRSAEGKSVWVWYLSPDKGIIGSKVQEGDRIGTAQDLTTKYPAKNGNPAITNHIHVRIKDGKTSLNPENLIP